MSVVVEYVAQDRMWSVSEQHGYIGTEVEYATYPRPVDGERLQHTVQHCARLIVRSTIGIDRRPGGCDFNAIGGKIYEDLGSHPEYATPECEQVADAVRQELIGEEYLKEGFLRALDNEIRDPETGATGISGGLYKKNSVAQQSWGVHENYQVSRDALPSLEAQRYWQNLAAHLTSRVILTGGGGYLGNRYYISPRSQFHADTVSHRTTDERPIINTRDEPLAADTGSWRRLHVITGDGNMSPWAIHLKVGTTRLITKAMEQGVFIHQYCPEDAVAAFRHFGKDLGARSRCQDGQERTALEIQRAILDRVQAVAVTEEEQEIVSQWQQALRALERLHLENRMSAFLGNIDWWQRWQIIDSKQGSNGHTAEKIDNLYDKLIDDQGRGGIAQKLREHGAFGLTPVDWSRERAHEAGSSNRAQLRGSVVAINGQEEPQSVVTWQGARDERNQFFAPFPDRPSQQEVTEYLATYHPKRMRRAHMPIQDEQQTYPAR